jgi:hypothetical protein
VVQQWSDCEEESETDDDSGEGGDDRFDRRIVEICRGVAPTSRIEAKRSSRLAADSRLAVAIRIRIGSTSATAPPTRMNSRTGPRPTTLWQP